MPSTLNFFILHQVFSDYLIDEYPEDVDSDYVFVSIWSHKVEPGTPLTYSVIPDRGEIHSQAGFEVCQSERFYPLVPRKL